MGLECKICFRTKAAKEMFGDVKKGISDIDIDVQNHSFTKLIFMAWSHAHTKTHNHVCTLQRKITGTQYLPKSCGREYAELHLSFNYTEQGVNLKAS